MLAIVDLVKATHVDEGLADLLPLVAGKRGIVVIPFWDKVSPSDFTLQVIRQWERTSNLAIVPIDARHLTTEQRRSILAAIDRPSAFPDRWQPDLAGWRIEPHPTWLEHPRVGWLLAIALLLIPAIIAVYAANNFAAIASRSRCIQFYAQWVYLD